MEGRFWYCLIILSHRGFGLPITARRSIVRTATRVMTTDAVARTKFRRNWSMILPGVVLIRKALLRAVKTQAERRAHAAQPEYETARSLTSTPDDDFCFIRASLYSGNLSAALANRRFQSQVSADVATLLSSATS